MTSVREKTVEDCLDFIGGRVVFSDGLSRLQYFKEFEGVYYRERKLKKIEYGRIFNLSEITEFLVILTLATERLAIDDPYETNYLLPKTIPLEKWKAADWKGFRANLVKIQTSMLRYDANASIDDILTNGDENREINQSRSQDPWFTDKLFKVLDLFTLHEKLAPFREALEIQSSIEYEGDKALMPMCLQKKLVRELINVVEEEEEKRIRKAFLSFFKNDQTYTLHSPSTIRRLLDDPSQPHSFTFLTNRVNKTMRAWVSQVFEQPTITGMNVSDIGRRNSGVIAKTESGDARALKRLQRSRALLNDHVEDPLASAVIAASNAKRNRKRKLYVESDEECNVEDRAFTGRSKHQTSLGVRKNMLDTKKSATRLEFTPEDESDSESLEDPKDVSLPEIKKRPKVLSLSPTKKSKSQQKSYEGRRIWTDSEKVVIIEGIKQFGIGKWAEIKREYFETLKFRTSGQIKDCYRTLKKRGELSDLDESLQKGTAIIEKDTENREEKENEGENENPAKSVDDL